MFSVWDRVCVMKSSCCSSGGQNSNYSSHSFSHFLDFLYLVKQARLYLSHCVFFLLLFLIPPSHLPSFISSLSSSSSQRFFFSPSKSIPASCLLSTVALSSSFLFSFFYFSIPFRFFVLSPPSSPVHLFNLNFLSIFSLSSVSLSFSLHPPLRCPWFPWFSLLSPSFSSPGCHLLGGLWLFNYGLISQGSGRAAPPPPAALAKVFMALRYGSVKALRNQCPCPSGS